MLRKIAAALLLCVIALASHPAEAAAKKSFKVAWSVSVGWMPWDYANRSGILQETAARANRGDP